MRVIVDGYNFIFLNERRPPWRKCKSLEAKRDAAERLLRRYAESTRSRVTVVFDSRKPLPDRPGKQTRGPLTVVYSTPSADEQIVDMLDRERIPAHVLIVTSDRELAARSRRRGAQTMDSQAFARNLDRQLAPRPEYPGDEPRSKYAGPSKDETEFWLDVFRGIDAEEES